jgi:hypothetical protein
VTTSPMNQPSVGLSQANLTPSQVMTAAHGPAVHPVEITNKLSKALGQAIVHCWSRLPRDVQHDLFEAAVDAEGEAIRQQLAIHLHGNHARTINSMQAQAMPEPDSLGG